MTAASCIKGIMYETVGALRLGNLKLNECNTHNMCGFFSYPRGTSLIMLTSKLSLKLAAYETIAPMTTFSKITHNTKLCNFLYLNFDNNFRKNISTYND